MPAFAGMTHSLVMADLDLSRCPGRQIVDGRVKPGHDEKEGAHAK